MAGRDRPQAQQESWRGWDWEDGSSDDSGSLFVSEELREAVDEILTSEELDSNEALTDLRFVLSSDDASLTFELVRMEQGPDGLTISGMGNRLAARHLLALAPELWDSLEILQGSLTVRSISLSGRGVGIGVELPDSSKHCFLTITCSNPPLPIKKKTVKQKPSRE